MLNINVRNIFVLLILSARNISGGCSVCRGDLSGLCVSAALWKSVVFVMLCRVSCGTLTQWCMAFNGNCYCSWKKKLQSCRKVTVTLLQGWAEFTGTDWILVAPCYCRDYRMFLDNELMAYRAESMNTAVYISLTLHPTKAHLPWWSCKQPLFLLLL